MMINVITQMHPIKSTSINKYYILGLSLIRNHLAVSWFQLQSVILLSRCIQQKNHIRSGYENFPEFALIQLNIVVSKSKEPKILLRNIRVLNCHCIN